MQLHNSSAAELRFAENLACDLEIKDFSDTEGILLPLGMIMLHMLSCC